MPKYRLTKASEKDLDEIWKYTNKTWGIRQASKYLHQIKIKIEELSNNPLIGHKRFNISKGLLSAHEGRHLIMYRQTKEGIIIIRILHDRMDVKERILETEE